ncbi:hypothetical protein NsoK4_04230 [Nitrosopumilus sp. K4]|uniref:hypothetical protein n=1 Tax=Nitrosopumilus sp. K4 TaxID=2795383 RepID=UPI001BAB9455|nr:hypothetical protein [Nitrosopumilus sp. K4]QUC65459.1 hypothetical protein NsoK4_04230 [Nitrosopumilus sp. K4]
MTKLGNKPNKRAISTVLTTIIILVASVVLGSGVVLYGTSLFQGGTQTEAMTVSGTQMWVHATDSNGLAWGAAKVRNTGDKVISVDKIQVRGSDVPFGNWYPDTALTASEFQQSLPHPGWSGVAGGLTADGACGGGETVNIDLAGVGDVCANAATGPVSLSTGQSAIIYFKLSNGTLSTLDSGINTSVNIFAGNAGAPQSVAVKGQS